MLPVSVEVTVPLSTLALVLIGCGISGAIVALILAVVNLGNKVVVLDRLLATLWNEVFDTLQVMTTETDGKSSDTA